MKDGDRVVADALAHARRASQGHGLGEFEAGIDIGRIIVANVYMGANPILTEGAKNEVRFLLRRNDERKRSR